MKKMRLCFLLAMLLSFLPMGTVYGYETLIPYDSVMPDEALKPRLVDAADLMTDSEEASLLSYLDEISEKQECDVLVVTTDSWEGMYAQDFADDYYDYNGFGMGEDHDGILLAISMGEREWAFSTLGYGIDAFTDLTLDYMEDRIIPYLSEGDYYGAFMTYAQEADAALEHARTLETGDYEWGEENPYYEAHTQKRSVFDYLKVVGIALVLSVLIGMVLGFLQKVVALKAYSGLINDTRENTMSYASNLKLTKDQVIMVNHGVQRIHSPEDDDDDDSRKSHVGRSTVHRSSSGRSHGGRSGRF